MSAHSHNRKCRELANSEADLQPIAPPANREIFEYRLAKDRKMNAWLHFRPWGAARYPSSVRLCWMLFFSDDQQSHVGNDVEDQKDDFVQPEERVNNHVEGFSGDGE